LGLFCPELPDEPPGSPKTAEEVATHNRDAVLLRFVVKKHRATRLHYDVRLEWNGVLKSWAVPEGPSCCASHRREAIEMEDHSMEYFAFEGVYPEGMPGAGPTMPWDLGTWEPLQECWDVEECLRNGCLKFTLRGEKLEGNWMFIRRPGNCSDGRRQVWHLVKLSDAFARSAEAPEIVDEKPNSVLSEKSLEEVELEGKAPKKKRKSGTLFDKDE
jgi:bifunctional non-homologous end joining protein LigD